MNYRFLDKQKTLHLGPWPALGLADARAKRDEARKQVAAGIDPSVEKKRAKIAARYAAAKPRRPMCENSVNQGLRRLGYSSDQMTAHGFGSMGHAA